jgi:hypothetical protein
MLTVSVDVVTPATTIDFGIFEVRWRRKDDSRISTTVFELPKVDVAHELVRIIPGISI